MKKIALLMDGWKRCLTFAWPSGICKRLRETGEEVNLYIFNSSGGWSKDVDYNIGEYNIFRLPKLGDFDGIILDLNNVRDQKAYDYIVDAAKRSGRPVVSIANKIGDFYYAGIDNYKGMQEMLGHVHKVHGCRKLWFIMGPIGNHENMARVEAIRDYMRENRMCFSDTDIYFGDYEFQSGYEGFLYMLKTHGNIPPQAVVCANDNIAVGVCEAAQTRGCRIPEDMLVTGFDNLDKAAFYAPRISTVSFVREETGYLCADILLRVWEGQDVPQYHYASTECIFWESCGCRPTGRSIDYAHHAKGQVLYSLEAEQFNEYILTLEYELMYCKSIQEMTRWIMDFIPLMKCDALYLLMDHHIKDLDTTNDFQLYYNMDEEFHVEGYPSRLDVEFAYEDGKVRKTEGMTVDALFPLFESQKAGTDYLFLPLHFKNHTVGVCVIKNAFYIMEKQYVFPIINTFVTALENLHKKEKLENMNQVLMNLYVRDAMTGMYNRMGYQRIAVPMFERKKLKNEKQCILFVDMDRLKYINDRFGHINGDFAIQTVAQAILNHITSDAVPVRMGGDEFLIMLSDMSRRDTERMIGAIRTEIEEVARQENLPYPLSISVGCVDTQADPLKTLDDYVRMADEVMYEEKTAKRANRKE